MERILFDQLKVTIEFSLCTEYEKFNSTESIFHIF